MFAPTYRARLVRVLRRTRLGLLLTNMRDEVARFAGNPVARLDAAIARAKTHDHALESSSDLPAEDASDLADAAGAWRAPAPRRF